MHIKEKYNPFCCQEIKGRRIHQICLELFKNRKSELVKVMANSELNVDEIVEKMIGYSDRIDTPFGEMCTISCDMG